jgi:hypothetical protein
MTDDEDIGPATMTLGAAIQVLSAVATNIGCMIGPDAAKDALRSVLGSWSENTKLILSIKAHAPKGMYQ